MGKGFPIDENFRGYKYDFPVQNVVLAATGTGIAPLRAAIESGALELSEEEDTKLFGRSCKLYWGCRDEKSMPWTDKIKEWDLRGVEVVPVLSEPSTSPLFEHSFFSPFAWCSECLRSLEPSTLSDFACPSSTMRDSSAVDASLTPFI